MEKLYVITPYSMKIKKINIKYVCTENRIKDIHPDFYFYFAR